MAEIRKNKPDHGLLQLARLYADQLDDAAVLHAAVLAALEECEPTDKRYVASLAKALVVRQTVSDIGPRYLAALTALQATPAARASARGPGEALTNDPADPADAAFLRLQDGARKYHAAAMDAAATSAHP